MKTIFAVVLLVSATLTFVAAPTVGGEKIGDKVFRDPPETRYTSYVWL